ncbi:hypothetical protein PV797_12475 [Clostridiaceae bacterium M8S5]|nr:hypothetical protein PV797_12475 [Clostridiaceae bacterium M8S5]
MARVNEETVLNFYLEMIEKDGVEFLKGKTQIKNKIKVYIQRLKKEEQIHNRIGVAKDLWKILFEAAMSFIHVDKVGYENLFSYFDKYVEFEELIFATDSFYRDHTLHCLWVYFLGEYIYYKDEFYPVVKEGIDKAMRLVKMISELSQDEEIVDILGPKAIDSIRATEKMVKMSQSVRCISALTHDLGYPIKKINRINASIGKILPNFSIKTFDEFDFSYNNEQVQFIKSFIDFIGDDISCDITITKKDEDKDKIKQEREKFVQEDDMDALINSIKESIKDSDANEVKVNTVLKHMPAQRLRYANDFETYQHGIMSAYLLMNTLRAFKTMNYHYKGDELVVDLESMASLGAKQDILKAISDHTCDGFTMKDLFGVSEFLTFVDELEEFSRISRGNQYRQYINEFCQSDLYMKGDVFHIDFIFNNDDIIGIDPERAFKGKCCRMLSLLDISNLDKSMNIHFRFIGELNHNKSIYELIIRKNFAQIIIDDKEQIIPEYLKSRDFLTREEYELMKNS